MPFATHFGIDASGLDGFHDTGVGGLSYSISVNIDTLDNWWRSQGSPRVDIIKIDTEGSELLVLEGGEELLQTHRPLLFIEISRRWLAPYSFSPEDVFGWFEKHGYCLNSLEGKRLTVPEMLDSTMLDASDNFVVQPITGRT